MPTPRKDPTFQPGAYVFGSSLAGKALFGRARMYPQTAIVATRPWGSQIAGWNTEDEMLSFLLGPREAWTRGAGPLIPFMGCRGTNRWGKRAVLLVRSGRQQVRRYRPSMGQQIGQVETMMLKLIDSMAIWREFSDATKKQLAADARKRGIKAYSQNYWNKLYLTDDPRRFDYV